MKLVHPALRIALVAGVVALTSFVGGTSHSSASIVFDDCPSSGGATPTPTPTPTSSTKPAPTPTAKPTPTPDPSAPPPQPTSSPAPQNCMPRTGERVWGTRTIKFHVNLGNFERIHHVALYVLANEKSGAKDVAAPLYEHTWTCGEPRGPTSFSITWDSVKLTPYNGKYQVLAEAVSWDNSVSCTDTTPADATRSGLLVDNPPPPPGMPKTIATTGSTITTQWDAPKVPDIVRYLVRRGVTSSTKKRPKYTDLKDFAYTTSPTFRDQGLAPGVYWYSVIAMRRSVVNTDGVISSQMSYMSPGVEIKAPPPQQQANSGPVVKRYIPLNRLALAPETKGSDVIPDAPYSAQLPYGDVPEQGSNSSVNAAGSSNAEPGGPATRGPVLPVAVGAFLVSAALALSRMPY